MLDFSPWSTAPASHLTPHALKWLRSLEWKIQSTFSDLQGLKCGEVFYIKQIPKKKKETNFSTEEANSSPNSVTKVLELAKPHDESSHFASSWNRGEGRGLGQKSSFSYLNHINHTLFFLTLSI